MAEQLPGGFGQFIRESEAAEAAAREAQNNQAQHEAKVINAAALNDLAELQAFGSRGRDYIDPATGQQIAGKDPATGEVRNLPGMVDRIRENDVFGKTPEDREAVAKQYTQTIEDFVGQGFETTQAKLLADRTLHDNVIGIPSLTRRLTAAGESPKEAQTRAEQLFNERNERRINSVRDHAFMTSEEYSASEAAREDSKELNQENLLTSLRLQDRHNQLNQVSKYMNMDPDMTLEEAQRKAAQLYNAKHTRQAKAIYENGIDSPGAYDDFLKRRAPGNTAPEVQPKPDNAETHEIPAAVDEGGRLAPEVDLRDLRDVNGDGLHFTELIAKRNANGGRLSADDEKRFNELRKRLNGEYPPVKELLSEPETVVELDAEAKKHGITRAELVKRLGNFEENQDKLRAKGLPTHEDRLPLTGDKLYAMFAADSPAVKYYVGEGGLTPRMHQLLVELTKNKGTDVKLFHMEGFKPVLNPQSASKRRARQLEQMVADINAERKVAVKWEKNKDTGKFEPTTDAPEKGAGDILLQQFMGNREVSTNTTGSRAARWIGRNLLRRSIPDYQPLPNGGERQPGRVRGFLGRLATRTSRQPEAPALTRAEQEQRDLAANAAAIAAMRNARRP